MSIALYNSALGIYRRTLKRSTVIHALAYGLAQRVIVSHLESCLGFHTAKDDPLYLRLSLLLGTYEPETKAVLRALLRPGMTVLDVGAHIGYYTTLFAENVGPRGRVIAFEPHPLTFSILAQNTASWRNVTLIEEAASNHNRGSLLYDSNPDVGSSSLQMDESKRDYYKKILPSGERAPRIAAGLPTSTYHVKTRTVDSFLPEIDVHRVDLIKMDIEGGELSALEGMRRTIQSSAPLWMVVELNPRSLESFGLRPERLLDEISGLGFHSIVAIDDEGGCHKTADPTTVVDWTRRLSRDYERVNLLCEKRQ